MPKLSCGIVGLPNVGKSTFFNALTAQKAEAANYPFCTIDPNRGTVKVQDDRLQALATLSHSKQIIYATVDFVDIAGLVSGAASGEGLGNQFLGNIRETTAIIHVVRCFDSSDIVHVAGKVDPLNDVQVINLELILADIQMLDTIYDKKEKQAKGNKELLALLTLFKKIRIHLDKGLPVRSYPFEAEERELVKPYNFLTAKPVLYVANVSEKDPLGQDNPFVDALKELAKQEKSLVIPICANIEAEIALLPEEERQEFLESLGLPQSGLQRVITSAFQLLGLNVFLTTGEMETRAWTITKGTTAAQAAGEIHSDIQKGFIRAEVVSYPDFITYGSRAAAREAGKARSEGRDYIVQDGDVILFMHQ